MAMQNLKAKITGGGKKKGNGGGAGVAKKMQHLSVEGGPGQQALAQRRPSATPVATVHKVRRRLSVVEGAQGTRLTRLDGAGPNEDPDLQKAEEKADAKVRPFKEFDFVTKVGYVPFNPEKVNQDRHVEVGDFGGDETKAFFGAYDGHGSLGHQVSNFVSTKLPLFCLKQKEPSLATDPVRALKAAYIECNTKLAKSNVDCTFSGTTAVSVYLADGKIFCANTGDSRAVLGQKAADGGLKAVPLSEDQKPDRKDEARRIHESGGRVEACKGAGGEDIGPPRVWLLHQDVPGLAMTRSFGDLIAASVGVIPEPEVSVREREPADHCLILASDGVWEFIDSQEACDLIAHCNTPKDACTVLVMEATKRWKDEEEVIDDITCVVVFL